MRESTRENVTVGEGWKSEERVCYTKPYEELEFTDDFMFCKVLTTNKELCKELLEVILKKKIRDIQFANGQQVMQIAYERNHRPTDEFTNKLQRKVKSAREHKEWRVEYMTYGLALQDAKREGRQEGRQEGRREGQEEKMMDLIYRKAKKGKPLSQIADELECNEEEIRGLYCMSESVKTFHKSPKFSSSENFISLL